MEDDELAAFRRAPDEWHRLKEEQQGQLMRDCSSAAQAFLNLVNRDVLSVQKALPTIVGASKSTVGLMLDGCEIDNLLIGGPAHNSGELDKGDVILAVDNQHVNPENIHENLLGADVPGSTVMLTVQKANSDVVLTVGLIRMPTAEIADKRRLFELFTALKAKSKAGGAPTGYTEQKSGGAGAIGGVASIDANDLFTSKASQHGNISNRRMGVDVSKGFAQLIDESVALWSKMVFEDARQKHQIVMNAKDIQQEGLELVDDLQGRLELLLRSIQSLYLILEDARREHSISTEKYKTYETIIVELREKLSHRTSELERCHNDKDKLFAELAKMRGRLDLLQSQQDNMNSVDELVKTLREQRDKAVSECEGLKGQVEEFKRLLKVEKDATIRAQSSEAEAKSEADRIRGQIKTIRDELMAAATDGRAARKETVDATTLAGGLKGEILVLKEQLAEFEMERVRQREHYDRTRGELDKARGEALQMRELNDGLRERVAQVETQLSEAKSEPFKMQGQIDELKSQLDESRDVLHRVEADADLQRRERDRLKGQLVEIKSQLASMRQQVEDKVSECDSAKSEAFEYSTQLERQKALMAAAREETSAHMKAAKAAEGVADKLRLDLSRAAAQLEEVEKLRGQLYEARQELLSKEEAVSRLVEEKNASRREMLMYQGQMAELKNTLEMEKNRTKSHEEAKDKEIASHEKTKGQVEAMKERCEGLQALVTEAEAKFSRSQVNLANARTDADKAKVQVQMLREQDAAKASKIRQLEEEIERLTAENTRLEAVASESKSRAAELEAAFKDAQAEKARARKEVVVLTAQLEELKKNADDHQRIVQELVNGRDRALEAAERNLAQVTAEKARSAALEDNARNQDRHIVKLKQDRENAYVEIEKTKSQLRALVEQVAQLERDLKDAEERVLMLQGRMAVAEDDLIKAQHALREAEDTIGARERALAALKDELAMLNSRIQEKDAHVAQLRQDLEEARDALKKVRQELMKAEKERDAAQRDYASCKVEVDHLKMNLEENREQLRAERSARADIEAERDKVLREHALCDQIIADLRHQITELEKQVRDLQMQTAGRQFCGAGLAVEESKNADGSACIRVLSLNPDGGAAETGLFNVGDEILAIDGTRPLSSQHVMSLARGLVGTEVTFTIIHNEQGYESTVIVKRKPFSGAQGAVVKAVSAFGNARANSGQRGLLGKLTSA